MDGMDSNFSFVISWIALNKSFNIFESHEVKLGAAHFALT